MPTKRKSAEIITVRPASPAAIRKAVKVTPADLKAAKRVISHLGLAQALRRDVKSTSAARVLAAEGRGHK